MAFGAELNWTNTAKIWRVAGLGMRWSTTEPWDAVSLPDASGFWDFEWIKKAYLGQTMRIFGWSSGFWVVTLLYALIYPEESVQEESFTCYCLQLGLLNSCCRQNGHVYFNSFWSPLLFYLFIYFILYALVKLAHMVLWLWAIDAIYGRLIMRSQR